MKNDKLYSTTISLNAVYYTFAGHVENNRPSYRGHQQRNSKHDEQNNNWPKKRLDLGVSGVGVP